MINEKDMTFYVAECSEFHEIGEFYKGITDVNEAVRLYEQIPSDRRHGVKTIGVMIPDEDGFEFEVDLIKGKEIDLDFLIYIPGFEESMECQKKISSLIKAFRGDSGKPEEKNYPLAIEMDDVSTRKKGR